jgi:mannosyltransferase OCH1-like enzyme
MSIPKILHQVWLGTKPIPDQFMIWFNGWKRLHPDWEYMLHIDKDIPEHLQLAIDKCSHYSSKSNILRLYVVYKYGGVYCDTDFEWNKNIDDLLKGTFIVAKQHGSLYCNAFFGAVEKSLVIKFQLDQINDFINQSPPWGPTLMTHAITKFKKDITILPTEYIYPYMWFEEYRPVSCFPDAYIAHHWSKSWGK